MIFGLVLIGLVVIFSYGMGNVAASSGSTVYVNGSSGNDVHNGSSWLLAKKSIQNATGTVTKGGTVNIANGIYTGTKNTKIIIDKNMTIKGQSQVGTIINGTVTNWIFLIHIGTNVTIKDLTLTKGTSSSDGGAIINFGTLTVNNSTFTSNSATSKRGGAIYNTGTLTVIDSKFTGNSADQGGAICNVGGTLNVKNSTFIGNTATKGGAIYCNGDSLTVTGSTFTSNTATTAVGIGGAIWNYGTLNVTNSTFTSNHATGSGGALYNSSFSTLTVSHSIFKNNIASGSGGAIMNFGALNIYSSTFTSNNAIGGIGGGAILSSGVTKFNGSTFTGNHALSGGAIYCFDDGLTDGSLTITSSTFTSNTATTGNGGAIYIPSGRTLTVTSSTFKINTAPTGGAIYCNGGSLNINNSIFTGNNASNYDGGAINNEVGTLIVSGSTFTSNTATYGGAIGNSGTANVRSSTFTNNTSYQGGAVINRGTMTLKANTFRGNSATYGGAVRNTYGNNLNITESNFIRNNAMNPNSEGGAILNSGTLTVTGSNFTSNTAIYGGGAIFNDESANIHFNRIVGNTANKGGAVYNSGTLDAELNWWGDNKSPVGKINGLTVNKWLVFTINASPISISNNGYSKITTDLIHDNSGTLQTAVYIPNGIPVHFTTTLGTMGNLPWSTSYGVVQAYLHAGTTHGTAYVYAKLDNQTIHTSVKILDIIPPKVVLTSPKNGATGISKTANISIKFSENIKASNYFNNITIKNLTTGKTISIGKSVSGATIYIKSSKKTANTWYTVTIPKSAIKDYAGNNLLTSYTFKFKTGV